MSLQDKRCMEQFRLEWDADVYDTNTTDLLTMRKDLLQQKKWARQVGSCWESIFCEIEKQKLVDSCFSQTGYILMNFTWHPTSC